MVANRSSQNFIVRSRQFTHGIDIVDTATYQMLRLGSKSPEDLVVVYQGSLADCVNYMEKKWGDFPGAYRNEFRLVYTGGSLVAAGPLKELFDQLVKHQDEPLRAFASI